MRLKYVTAISGGTLQKQKLSWSFQSNTLTGFSTCRGEEPGADWAEEEAQMWCWANFTRSIGVNSAHWSRAQVGSCLRQGLWAVGKECDLGEEGLCSWGRPQNSWQLAHDCCQLSHQILPWRRIWAAHLWLYKTGMKISGGRECLWTDDLWFKKRKVLTRAAQAS